MTSIYVGNMDVIHVGYINVGNMDVNIHVGNMDVKHCPLLCGVCRALWKACRAEKMKDRERYKQRIRKI